MQPQQPPQPQQPQANKPQQQQQPQKQQQQQRGMPPRGVPVPAAVAAPPPMHPGNVLTMPPSCMPNPYANIPHAALWFGMGAPGGKPAFADMSAHAFGPAAAMAAAQQQMYAFQAQQHQQAQAFALRQMAAATSAPATQTPRTPSRPTASRPAGSSLTSHSTPSSPVAMSKPSVGGAPHKAAQPAPHKAAQPAPRAGAKVVASAPEPAAAAEARRAVLAKAPQWLRKLLTTPFFRACPAHSMLRKAEHNYFCMECAVGFCQHCMPRHVSHNVLQIRRYVYHDVVRLSDISPHIDVSGVQPYIINSAQVIFLNERPQPRPGRGSGNVCRTCARCLQEPHQFCSLACKAIKLLGDGVNLELSPDKDRAAKGAAAAAAPAPQTERRASQKRQPPPVRSHSASGAEAKPLAHSDARENSAGGSGSHESPALPLVAERRKSSVVAQTLSGRLNPETLKAIGLQAGAGDAERARPPPAALKRSASAVSEPEAPVTSEGENEMHTDPNGNAGGCTLKASGSGSGMDASAAAFVTFTSASRRKKKARPLRAA